MIRQSKVVQILSDGGAYSSGGTSSPGTSSPVGSTSGLKNMAEKDDAALREEEKRATNKREKAFSRLRKTLSNRGQKLMEKMAGGNSPGANETDQRLTRSSSRDNLTEQAKLPGSERISRSTSHLADIRGNRAAVPNQSPNSYT